MMVIDWVMIVIALFGALKGYFKGFVYSLLSSCKYIIAILISWEWSGEVSRWLLNRWQLEVSLYNLLWEIYPLPENMEVPGSVSAANSEQLLTVIRSYLQEIHLPLNLHQVILNNLNEGQIKTIIESLPLQSLDLHGLDEVVVLITAKSLAKIIASSLAIVLIFAVTILVFSIIIWTLNQLVIKLGDMNYFNRVAGALWGGLFSLFVIYIFIQFFYPLISALPLRLEDSLFLTYLKQIAPAELFKSIHTGWGAG